MRSAIAVGADLPVVVGADLKVGPCRISEPGLTLRAATADDAPAIHALITSHLDEGHLLPRQTGEIAIHASRFVVMVANPARAGLHEGGKIVGCADLAPLSRTVAEIRSLIVSAHLRSNGVGRRLIDALIARARASGFERLCAFTHAPSYFVRHGFSLVPHDWLPEKIRTDCGSCAFFRKCGQYAVMLPFTPAPQSSTSPTALDGFVPLASLHG